MSRLTEINLAASWVTIQSASRRRRRRGTELRRAGTGGLDTEPELLGDAELAYPKLHGAPHCHLLGRLAEQAAERISYRAEKGVGVTKIGPVNAGK